MPKTSKNHSAITTCKKITAEQTIIVIRLIKKYRNIWDKDHPDFRKHQIRYNAFKKIGSYFKLSADDVSRKYRRFRNCYIQELKMIRDKKKTFSNLFYFDEMEFLRDQVGHRSSKNSSSPTFNTIPDAVETDSNPDTDDLLIPIESLEDEYSMEPMEDFQLSSNDSNHSNQGPIIVDEKEIKEEVVTSPIEVNLPEECPIEEISLEEELTNSTNGKADEFDIFSGYLASQLREMDKISALETMEELQRIIFKRRIQILKRDQQKQ